MSTPATRAGFVAVVGAPNAGKSTLVNGLVGSKVSIVSPKVQTTRMRVIGIAMTDLPDRGEGASRAQVILVDTPGHLHVWPSAGWSGPWSPRPGRGRRMPTCRGAGGGRRARRSGEETEGHRRAAEGVARRRAILVLNKIDSGAAREACWR
jgi:hypothetical protein